MSDLGANITLASALEDAELHYAEKRPLSRAHMENASKFMPGGNTRSVLFFTPFPIVVKNSSGCRIWDLDGHEYVDFLGEYTAGLFGHSESTIKEAIWQALEKGWVSGAHIEDEARLAQSLCSRFPSIESIRFTNSGTEANLMALVTARVFTKRSRIMVFQGGYHGGVLLYKTGDAPQNVPFPVIIGRYNDIEQSVATIEREASDLAAVIIEPLQGSAGCIAADRDFLRALRVACSHHGIVLIFDEVMTSRLAYGGLQSAIAVTPDLTTLGKYVGGGMSFGAFGGRNDIMALYDPKRSDALAHAGTFNNNVMTMAAGVAAAKLLTSSRLEQINECGNALRTKLNQIARSRGLPLQLTGYGSMMNIHFHDRSIRNIVDAESGGLKAKAFFHLEMMARGQYLARRGMINLSLPMTAVEFDGFTDAFEDFLSANERVIATG